MFLASQAESFFKAKLLCRSQTRLDYNSAVAVSLTGPGVMSVCMDVLEPFLASCLRQKGNIQNIQTTQEVSPRGRLISEFEPSLVYKVREEGEEGKGGEGRRRFHVRSTSSTELGELGAT